MPWSRNQRRGLILTCIGTAIVTALTLFYLWAVHTEGVATLSFLGMTVVIIAVWGLIGATMAFFIVMIIRKNERIRKD